MTSWDISLCLSGRHYPVLGFRVLRCFIPTWQGLCLHDPAFFHRRPEVRYNMLVAKHAPHSLLLCSRVCSCGSAQVVSILYMHVAIQLLYVLSSMPERSDCHGHFPIMLQISLLLIWSSNLNSLLSTIFWGGREGWWCVGNIPIKEGSYNVSFMVFYPQIKYIIFYPQVKYFILRR